MNIKVHISAGELSETQWTKERLCTPQPLLELTRQIQVLGLAQVNSCLD